jgi:uracil-DNA glycosylase
MPMGFCYPGRGKGGDLPPRPECAPLWHGRLRAHLPEVRLTLLVGSYAIREYLPEARAMTLTEAVRAWDGGSLVPLVHPSPRNRLWLRRNPWFEEEMVPRVRALVAGILGDR